MGESNAPETNNITISSKQANGILVAVITALASLGVAYIANKPDTSDRYYGHQGAAAERRIGLIEEWVRQHTIFGWQNLNASNERFARLESEVKHAAEISRECMEKIK